jgi:hypothetical protein
MKITKVTRKYFETEDERIYFFEPLDEDMTVAELQELMDENEKFVKEELPKIKEQGRVEQITEPSVIDKCECEYDIVEDGLIQSGKCKKCGEESYRLRPETKITMPNWMEEMMNSGKPSGQIVNDIMKEIKRRNKK